MLIPGSGKLYDQFPAGLRVLVVDDDPLCLKILEKMLKECLYEVTKCNRAEIALKYLRDNKNGFDIVISDVHMPDMDGFMLLEQVGLEMDLPVIMMSADDSKNVVMKGVTYGACDYLIKPVSMEALKNIWQHMIRKTKHELKDKDFGLNGCVEDGERKQKSEVEVDNNSVRENEENSKNLKKRKDEEEEEEDEDVGKDDKFASKKPRVVWSRELHLQFLAAVDHLGYDKAVPKRILEVMNVPGLTRENIASHLQKYRICLRKKYTDVSQHQNGVNSPYMSPLDKKFGSISSFHGNDFQALPTNGFTGLSLAMLQSLVKPSSNKSSISVMDQRNDLFRFESPVEPQLGGRNADQMSLTRGITNIESNQLTSLNQPITPPLGNMNVQMIAPVTQPISRALMPNQHNGSSVSTHVSSLGQSMNGGEPPLYGYIFPNARNTGFLLQGDSKVSKGFVNDYGYFDELQQYETPGLQTVGSTIDVSHHHHHALQGTMGVVPQSSFVQTNGQQDAFFTHSSEGGQNGYSNFGLPIYDSFVTDKGSSIPSNLFSQQSGSDEIFSELLKPVDEFGSIEYGFGFDDYPIDNLLA